MQGKKKSRNKGKVTECQFNGNERTGIIAYLNQLCGDDDLGSGIFKMSDGLGSGKDILKLLLIPDRGCYDLKTKSLDKS